MKLTTECKFVYYYFLANIFCLDDGQIEPHKARNYKYLNEEKVTE